MTARRQRVRHVYSTLYARSRINDTVSSLLVEFLGVLDGLDTEVKPFMLAANSTTASVSRCSKRINTLSRDSNHQLGKGDSTGSLGRLESRHSANLTEKLDGHNWTVEFPVYIDFN